MSLASYDDRVSIDAQGRVVLALETSSQSATPTLVGIHGGAAQWAVEGRYEFIAAIPGKPIFLAYSRQHRAITSIDAETGKRSKAHALKPEHARRSLHSRRARWAVLVWTVGAW